MARALPIPAGNQQPVHAIAKNNEIVLRRGSSGSYTLIATGPLPYIFQSLQELRTAYMANGAVGVPDVRSGGSGGGSRKTPSAATRKKMAEAQRKRQEAARQQPEEQPASTAAAATAKTKPKTMAAGG